jgi:hypothetical protein
MDKTLWGTNPQTLITNYQSKITNLADDSLTKAHQTRSQSR